MPSKLSKFCAVIFLYHYVIVIRGLSLFYGTAWHGTARHILEAFKTLFYGTEQQI